MEDTILSSPRPWVVCDWGAFRGLRRGVPLAGGFSLVLGNTFFLEAVDSTPLERMIGKLREILEHPSIVDRVLIASHGPHFVDAEVSPRTRFTGADLIDVETTKRLRSYLRHGGAWPENLLRGRMSPHFEQYRSTRDGFVRQCNEFADHPAHQEMSSVRALRTGRWSMTDWIRHPDLCPQFATALDGGRRYRRPAWQKELRVFPDRTAIGRLLRLLAWYAMLRVRLRERSDDEYGNNYEDAMYAFLASYMFEIATNDRGLQDCVRAVFPRVRFRESLVE